MTRKLDMWNTPYISFDEEEPEEKKRIYRDWAENEYVELDMEAFCEAERKHNRRMRRNFVVSLVGGFILTIIMFALLRLLGGG